MGRANSADLRGPVIDTVAEGASARSAAGRIRQTNIPDPSVPICASSRQRYYMAIAVPGKIPYSADCVP